MEEPPSGGCQLGDRGNNFETWADCPETHEQEPMKLFFFEPRSMIQEHPQRLHVIKRASAHRGKNIQLDEPAHL